MCCIMCSFCGIFHLLAVPKPNTYTNHRRQSAASFTCVHRSTIVVLRGYSYRLKYSSTTTEAADSVDTLDFLDTKALDGCATASRITLV